MPEYMTDDTHGDDFGNHFMKLDVFTEVREVHGRECVRYGEYGESGIREDTRRIRRMAEDGG